MLGPATPNWLRPQTAKVSCPFCRLQHTRLQMSVCTFMEKVVASIRLCLSNGSVAPLFGSCSCVLGGSGFPPTPFDIIIVPQECLLSCTFRAPVLIGGRRKRLFIRYCAMEADCHKFWNNGATPCGSLSRHTVLKQSKSKGWWCPTLLRQISSCFKWGRSLAPLLAAASRAPDARLLYLQPIFESHPGSQVKASA